MADDNILDHVGRAAGKCLEGAQAKLERLQSSFTEAFRARNRGNLSIGNPLAHQSAAPVAFEKDTLNDVHSELEPWRKNPEWVDETANLEITVPKGALCQMKSSFKLGLPPKKVYDILIDPGNKRVFQDIQEVKHRKVLEDHGHRQIVELEQAAIWRFLWLSGTLSVWVKVEQDSRDLSVKYELGRPGFMKRFQGSWNIEPLYVDAREMSPPGRVASIVNLQQVVEPSIMPPPPISWYVRGITRRTMEKLLTDLQAECKRVRETGDGMEPSNAGDSHDDEGEDLENVVLHRYKKGECDPNHMASRNRKRNWRRPE